MNVRKAAQLLSDTVVQALQRYGSHKKYAYLFKGSETTAKFTRLMNAVFDILNGRFIAQGIQIANWGKKKEKLDTFLKILDITEELNITREKNDPNIPVKMFISQTTLESWRVSVLSVIALTEEKFNAGYTTVLTGKLNQDPIEVIYYNELFVLIINIFSISVFLELSEELMTLQLPTHGFKFTEFYPFTIQQRCMSFGAM